MFINCEKLENLVYDLRKINFPINAKNVRQYKLFISFYRQDILNIFSNYKEKNEKFLKKKFYKDFSEYIYNEFINNIERAEELKK